MKRWFAWLGLSCALLVTGCAQSAIDQSQFNIEPGDAATAYDAGQTADASGIDAHIEDAAQPTDAAVDAFRAQEDAGRDAGRPPEDASVVDASVEDAATLDAGDECPACLFPGSICRNIFGSCGCQLIPLGICTLPPFL